ncbi:MAG: outer membrane beta-barrel protein [Candidatus Aminicenantales bacterium]
MKRFLVIFVLLALLGTAAQQSYALVGVYAGAFGGISTQKLSFEDVRFDTDTTFLYGLRLGIQVVMFALELNYYRAGHNISMGDFYLFQWDGMADDTSFIGGNLRVMFPITIFRPFLSLGYGFYTVDLHDIDKDTEGGFNVGLGLEVKLGKLAIIGEGKYNNVNMNLNDLDFGFSHFTFTAGLNYYF